MLQAGTAVLVDDKGEPVTKCYCGNPLTPPVAYPPVYYGPKWSGYSPNSLTVIIKNTTVINIYTLVDPKTGNTFTRPAGSNGTDDTPTGPPTSTPNTTPNTTPTAPHDAEHDTEHPGRAHTRRQGEGQAAERRECRAHPFPAPIEQATSQTLSIESGTGPDNFVLLVHRPDGVGRTGLQMAGGQTPPERSHHSTAWPRRQAIHCSGLN